MPAHLTAAQAKALGIKAGEGDVVAGASKSPARTRQRRTARGPYASECFDCGATFDTQASETRHLNATRHARYQLQFVIEGGTDGGPHDRKL